mmetsp:Transcript_4987/g.19176  ORF Transcript_4987/g.19176 Transcript_4987/m.19176 type:complete len:85 (-) Transcript_4987:1336-1590(-)
MFKVLARARVSLERLDVQVCRLEWTFGVFEIRARVRVSLGRVDVHVCHMHGQLECLKYACARGCAGSARYAEAMHEVVFPDADV